MVYRLKSLTSIHGLQTPEFNVYSWSTDLRVLRLFMVYRLKSLRLFMVYRLKSLTSIHGLQT